MARFQSGSGGEAAQSVAMCVPLTTPSRCAPRKPGHSTSMTAGVTAAADAMGTGGRAAPAAAVVVTAAAGATSGVPEGATGAALAGAGLVAVGVAGAGT